MADWYFTQQCCERKSIVRILQRHSQQTTEQNELCFSKTMFAVSSCVDYAQPFLSRWPLGSLDEILKCNFQYCFFIFRSSQDILTCSYWRCVDVGSGNGFEWANVDLDPYRHIVSLDRRLSGPLVRQPDMDTQLEKKILVVVDINSPRGLFKGL